MTPFTGPPADSDNPPWFPVEITGGDAAAGYTAREVYLDGTGARVPKLGGRLVGAANPGFPLVTGGTFAAGDLAMARSGPGAAGLTFELLPVAAAAAAATPVEATILTTAITADNLDAYQAVAGGELTLPAAGLYLLYAGVTGRARASVPAASDEARLVAAIMTGGVGVSRPQVVAAVPPGASPASDFYGSASPSVAYRCPAAGTAVRLAALRLATAGVTWGSAEVLAAAGNAAGTYFGYARLG